MGNPAGEIPQVVFLHIGNKALPVLINGRDPRTPVEHHRPFVRRRPVQFTNAPRSESHVHACQFFRDGKFPDGRLVRPSAFLAPLVRKRERIFDRLHQALRIGSGWPLGIRICRFQRSILRARVAFAPVLFGIPRLLPGCPACRQDAGRCKSRRTYADKSPASQYLFLCLFRCAIAHASHLSESSWFPSQRSKSDLAFDDSTR